MLEVRPFSFRDRRFRELSQRNRDFDPQAAEQAEHIISRVRGEGSTALHDCIRIHDSDQVRFQDMRVAETEIMAARELVPEQFLTALSLARVNLRKFHEYQRRRGYLHDDGDGVELSRRVRPLSRVGICCGGSFAALLLHAVPAQVAGVGKLAVAALPRPDGEIDAKILATAKVLGIDEIYRMSGAHAVAALAFGVEPVERVDKIVGPGSGLTRPAKRLVRDCVGVDAGRGDSELVVIADDNANARFIAADLLAQAERGGRLMALLTTDRLLAEAVRIEMNRMVEEAEDAAKLREAFVRGGGLYVCKSLDQALDAANVLAPARLALVTRDNEACLAEIDNAGTVLMGPWTMEAAECFAGAGAFLPVAGSARWASGLGVEDFVREMTVLEYGPERLLKTGRHITALAEADGHPRRARAADERLELLHLAVE